VGLNLILCAGNTRRPGWMTLDANTEHRPDIVAMIPPLPAEVTRAKWHEIELIHGITTFHYWEAKLLLKEIKQVLVSGGKLVLEQPDFDKAKIRVEWLFGDPLFRNPLHMNKWAYTPRTLEELLKEAGFTNIQQLPAQYHIAWRDFRMEAQA
jgi:hypothetical protein